MKVLVEFFGIPRLRIGVAEHTIEVPDDATIERLYVVLASQLPAFAEHCLTEHKLLPGFIASINGRRFVKDSSERIHQGDAIQILSADVGG